MHQWPHTFLPPPLRPCCACQGCPLLFFLGGGGRSNTGGVLLHFPATAGKICALKANIWLPPPTSVWLLRANQAALLKPSTVLAELVNSRASRRGGRRCSHPSADSRKLHHPEAEEEEQSCCAQQLAAQKTWDCLFHSSEDVANDMSQSGHSHTPWVNDESTFLTQKCVISLSGVWRHSEGEKPVIFQAHLQPGAEKLSRMRVWKW